MMLYRLPEGLQIRRPVEADLEDMCALTQAYDIACYGETDFTLQDMRVVWEDPSFDPATQAYLIFDTDGRLICSTCFYEQSHIRYGLSLDFLPGYEDSRIRGYLMELCEEWARQDMVKAPTDSRIFLRPWVAARNAAANAWFRSQPDFIEVRRFWEMQIELDAEPRAAIWPEGVTLRPFVGERDARAVFEADEEFFIDHWGHLAMDYELWQHWTVQREDFDPSLWFVAWAGEKVVGISLCRDGEKGWVDTLGVARSWRGKGLGLALLHHSFGAFYRRGRNRVGLGVDSESLTGATRLYERAGMHVAHENIIYEKELRAGVDLSIQTLAV